MRLTAVVFLSLALVAALVAAAPEPAAAGEPADFAALEKQFHSLPVQARRLCGPLFWLHGDESPERLRMYVDKVAEGGNGTFTAESRPHRDWLGEGWYRDLGICLEGAKKHNLTMWIFDEKWWPSGEVGGKVPPQYGCKRLQASTARVTGPKKVDLPVPAGPQFIAVIAGKLADGGIDGATLVDLAGSVKDGRLAWNAPAGDWAVVTFTWKHTGGHRILVDGASRDCVDWYIKTVYQPHFDRFKEDFGKTIVGYFYDEPETPGDWGTEVLPILKERGVDWKKALTAWKVGLAGEEQAAAKYQYQDAQAEAWGRTLYAGLSRWCREHKVQSIGHFLEHNREYLKPDLCAGNMMQLQKYSDMGAIDAVFDQFIMGQRVSHGDRWVWQTPKLGSSISHVYGKPDDVAMVEIFGARGQDLTYPEMKWWTDHMQVSGINFMIPHSFNPRAPFDTDCPPYFYNGGFEPRWPLYKVYADWTSRLSLMLTGGRHVCPVALLYVGNSVHVGKAVPPEDMTSALQDALYDCDWLPYDAFAECRIEGKGLKLHGEDYRVLVVPPVEVIPYDTLAKVKAFFDAGGVVVGYGFLHMKSATLGKSSADVAALREAVWGDARPGLAVCRTNAASGRSYLLPEKPTPEQLVQVLGRDAGARRTLDVLEGDTGGWLHVLHRQKGGRDVFLVCNQNVTGPARTFRLSAAARGVPECWDAMRDEITSLPHRRAGDRVVFDLTLEPNESVLVVFSPEIAARPARLTAEAKPLGEPIPVVRVPGPPVVTPAPKRDPVDLKDCSWVWYPEGNPLASAPVGTRWFRKTLTLPPDRPVKQARFLLTADNEFTLFVNGQEAGQGQGWTGAPRLDVTKLLKAGDNVLEVKAVNTSDKPNPAGLIGKLTVEFSQGPPLVVRIDRTWQGHQQKDDAGRPALEMAPYGKGPWGDIDKGGVTTSPAKLDPFEGKATVPASVDLGKVRAYLEVEGIPEDSARVTVNGKDAGGFIGRPLRLPVTGLLRAGENTIRLEPAAPKAARVVLYPRE